MVLEWFSLLPFLNYKKNEDGFGQLYQNQKVGPQSLPSYECPVEEEIARGHPTMLEGEVV